MSYLLSANSVEGVGPITWIGERLRSLGNTLIPLRIPLFEQDNPSVNVYTRRSDGVIHFFFEYWNGVPFGVGIVFFPFLVMSMVRLARRYPWIVVSLVVVPFVVFAVYWGSFVSGLMREGLHAWIVGVLILSALEIAPLLAGGGPGAMVLRCVLVLRPVEALVMRSARRSGLMVARPTRTWSSRTRMSTSPGSSWSPSGWACSCGSPSGPRARPTWIRRAGTQPGGPVYRPGRTGSHLTGSTALSPARGRTRSRRAGNRGRPACQRFVGGWVLSGLPREASRRRGHRPGHLSTSVRAGRSAPQPVR